jgi:L-threonylcarbamoyladenylate synthase
MKVIQVDLNKDYTEALLEAIAVLRAGGVIVFPTDTLYGMGANALDAVAVERVFNIKKRDRSKPFPLMIRNMLWARELAVFNKKKEEVTSKVWPGRVTVVLHKKPIIPSVVSGGSGTIGLRVPDFDFTDKLLGKFGYPITCTSANISGEEGTGDINKIIPIFRGAKHKPDLVIDAGVLPKSAPSTVLDLTEDKPRILRVGPSKPKELLKLLEI